MEFMMVDTRENGGCDPGCLLLAFPMAPMERQRHIEAACLAQRKLEGQEFS